MPRKTKDRDRPEQATQSKSSDPLPQVWLPDQLDISGASYDKGPHVPIATDSRPGEDRQDASAAMLQSPLPTQDEEESMARFWAMEEANAPRGWEDEQELDYEELSKKAALTKRKTSVGQEIPGTPDLFSYAQTSSFAVRYLGKVSYVAPQSNIGSSESQIGTLEDIDMAQRQGRVPWVTSPRDACLLSLSKYGIKVTDEKKQRVFARFPLHTICNITYYEDTYSKHMVVLRIGQPHQEAENDLVIYECTDEPQAKDICLTLAQAFDAVFNKIRLQQNLHTPDVR